MSKDDDFFDKYVDNHSSKTPRKGNVKKDLFASKTEKGKKTEEAKDKNKTEEIKKEPSKVAESKVKKEKAYEQKQEEKPLSQNKIQAKEKLDEPKKTTVAKSSSKTKALTNIEESQKDSVKETLKEDLISATKDALPRKTKITKETSLDEIVDRMDEENVKSEVIFAGMEKEEEEEQEKGKKRSRKKTSKVVSIEDYNTNYVTKTLSQTLHESMIPYSEFVIMDRAIPRVEDGLKPVQRRVLYSMYEVGVMPDRPHKKSASIVGECMGKYHPHGDTSIYDTLVRLAQPFNMSEPLVDGHGNFGTIDGDSAAAMRYTEARLSPVALEMLRDLEKDTVPWGLNFDDSLKEPQLLPSRFPNLLVNGCQGIAVGLATNIPTHNLIEVSNAVIAYIENRNITTDELLKIMPGPDFPGGGYVLDTSELKQVYETGKGKIYIRSKISIENADNGRKNIVISEVPYQVNKANMLMKIEKYKEANLNGPMGGILEVVDESDKTGIRAVIKLKKDAKINAILNTIYKYCDVQVTFGANIVAIADGKPKQLSLKEILEYYTNFQQSVIVNRTKFDLNVALEKEHIYEGLLIAIVNIDEVIRIIRTSKNTTEAKIRLMQTFELTDRQAQAILDMRLAKLTSLEVDKLRIDLNHIRDKIKKYNSILKSQTLQLRVVKSELQDVVKSYGTPRKSKFLSAEEHFEDSTAILESIENEEDDIQTFHFISTPANTLKLINLKSYNLVNKELSANASLTEVPKISFKIDDNKQVHLFTNIGDAITLDVKSIPECKFRDKGTPLMSLMKNTIKDENIVGVIEMDSAVLESNLIFVTKLGMVKISKAKDFVSSKHVISAIKLAKNDEIVYVDVFNPSKQMTMFTKLGNAVKFDVTDLAPSGRVGVGIKGIDLDKGDFVVGASQTAISDAFALFMSDGSAKIIKQSEIPESSRNRKGQSYISPKSKNSTIMYAGRLSTKVNYAILDENDKLNFVVNSSLPIDTRLGSGKVICKNKVVAVYPFTESRQ